jgi:NAD(P)-dependent dehydrogenase (short-subunit alcohol dehydrogenase family)
MSTDKKVAIITGSARGIGAATLKVFARHGYAVAGLDILPEGEKVAFQINQEGGECTFFTCDVSDEARVAECVGSIAEKYGHMNVLVNNAGVVLVKPFDQITWDEFCRTTQVNLGGHFLMCKYVLPYMKRQKSGVIINMGSVSGHVGQTDHAMYGATKGAIIAMTRALAWELAPYNIRVNSISPGSVDTPMLRSDIELESRPLNAGQTRRRSLSPFSSWPVKGLPSSRVPTGWWIAAGWPSKEGIWIAMFASKLCR